MTSCVSTMDSFNSVVLMELREQRQLKLLEVGCIRPLKHCFIWFEVQAF